MWRRCRRTNKDSVLSTLNTQQKRDPIAERSLGCRRSPEVGVESPPVVGRLGGVEPMTKPHFRECGFLLAKGVIAFGNRQSTSTIVARA